MNPELVKLISLSQRSLQNSSAYVAISLALLAYARFYRGKGNALYNVAFIIISAAVLLLSIRLLHLLLNQLNMYKNKLSEEDMKVLNDFTLVPKTLMYVLYVILAFSFYTLYRQLL